MLSAIKRFGLPPLIRVAVMSLAVIAGVAYFAATPTAHGLTLGHSDLAYQAAHRIKGQGQDTANAYAAVQDTISPLKERANPGGDTPAPPLPPKQTVIENGQTLAETAPDSADGSRQAAVPNDALGRNYQLPGSDNSYTSDVAPGSQQYRTDQLEIQANAGKGITYAEETIIAVRNEWSPRYREAKKSHTLLVDRVGSMKRYAASYLESQQEIINRINTNASNGAVIKAGLQETLRQQNAHYTTWQQQTDITLSQSRQIIEALDNVDLAMQFAEDAARFSKMVYDPVLLDQDLQNLEADMASFQADTLQLLEILTQDPSP